jgi:P27 family predicted phage terminase small subunit
MGRRGPKPTPTAVLRLRGSWRGKANKAEPQPEATAPDCPMWLSTAAKDVWGEVVAILAPTRVLTRADGKTLARYCEYFVRWKAACAFLEKNGEVYTLKDDAGNVKCVMPWPQVSQYHKCATMLLKIEEQFGMTPSSRSRIQVPSEDDKPQAKSRFFQAG